MWKIVRQLGICFCRGSDDKARATLKLKARNFSDAHRHVLRDLSYLRGRGYVFVWPASLLRQFEGVFPCRAMVQFDLQKETWSVSIQDFAWRLPAIRFLSLLLFRA